MCCNCAISYPGLRLAVVQSTGCSGSVSLLCDVGSKLSAMFADQALACRYTSPGSLRNSTGVRDILLRTRLGWPTTNISQMSLVFDRSLGVQIVLSYSMSGH